jgi:hypothetical protein
MMVLIISQQMPTLKTWKTNNGNDYLNVTTSSWASNYDQPIKK